jgi:photosystem II stability/assembly factor-like uncharacterized protein
MKSLNKFISVFLILFFSMLSFAQRTSKWEKLSSPTSNNLRKLYFVDSLNGWAVGQLGTIINTNNGGENWSIQNSGVTSPIVDIYFLNKNLGWALTIKNTPPFGTIILKTTNSGINWLSTDFPSSNKFMSTIFFIDEQTGWIGGSGISKTTDSGVTWIESSVDSGVVSTLPVLNFNFLNEQYGFACGGALDLAGVVWRTTDSGMNWTSEGISPDQIFDLFVFDSLHAVTLSGDPEGIYGIGLISTSDGGLSWSFDELPFFGLSFAIDFTNDSCGWSASGLKFLFTSDQGKTWSEVNTPDSSSIFDLQFVNEHTGFACGLSGTILKYYNKTTSIEAIQNLPTDFTLYQNYPNPFNPSTSIQYAITRLPDGKAGKQFVSLKVYDVLGNEVATLVDEYKSAGTYDVEFNASSLASGVYFYQLLVSALQSKDGKAGDFIHTKKMVLIR